MSGEIESALVEIKGVYFRVDIDPDYDAKPTDADCYSDADVTAWRNGDWRYVGVTVSVSDHPSMSDSLWAIEFGSMPTAEITLSRLINDHPVPDMVSELRAQVVKLLAGWEE